MEYKVFGVTINIVNVIICVALGFLICVMIGCDCVNVKNMLKGKEGFVNGSSTLSNSLVTSLDSLVGATPAMDAGSVEKKGCNKAPMAASVQGEKMFYLNESDVSYNPSCCPSTYTNSMGCACLTDKQYNYLNSRGGNRTMPTEF